MSTGLACPNQPNLRHCKQIGIWKTCSRQSHTQPVMSGVHATCSVSNHTLPCLCMPPALSQTTFWHVYACATHSVSITAPVCSSSFIWAKVHSKALSVTLVDYLAEIHGSPTHWPSMVPWATHHKKGHSSQSRLLMGNPLNT